jgi:hypothetical protein
MVPLSPVDDPVIVDPPLKLLFVDDIRQPQSAYPETDVPMLQDTMQPLFVAPLAEDPLQAATMHPIPVPHESAPNADEPLPEAIALNERLFGSAPTMRFVFIVDACSIVDMTCAPYSAIRISSAV